MKFGIVGARLAGSYASLMLSRAGHEVLLFDPSIGGEKACGGGITAKALLTMPWFCEQKLPHGEIRTVELRALEGRAAVLPLSHPIHVFSRAALDDALRKASIQAGAHFVPERSVQIAPVRGGWEITTTPGSRYEVDFLVGADGASSSVRALLSGKLAAGDLSLAVGYYLPGVHHPDKVVIVFQERGFQGYLWSFPRVDHASVGIIHRLTGIKTPDLRRRVRDFIRGYYPDTSASESAFYAARVPCLRHSTLRTQRTCGRNWALLGDAAGFVDAITGEGIYFALRSAELLANSLKDGDPQSYERRWRLDFGANLERAAAWCDHFYAGTFLMHAITRRAVQMIRGSATVRRIIDGLICGRHTYMGMRSNLILQSPRILSEAMRTAFSTSR